MIKCKHDFFVASFAYGSTLLLSASQKIGSGLVIVPLLSLVETMAIGKAFGKCLDVTGLLSAFLM